MAELQFECVDVTPDLYAMGPTLQFKLRITEDSGARLHTVALRCQLRIEPQRRGYAPEESELLVDVFGARERWGDTLKPFQFANASTMVAGFTGETEIVLDVPVSYDIDVAVGKYFHALRNGEVPLLLMFSGTVYGKGDQGLWVQQVPWHAETRYRLPVSVWQELMDRYFPGSGWLRLTRETIDALTRYKISKGLATWEETVGALLDATSEAVERPL
jgi:Family of unknown function (DUF6084)